MSIQRDIDAELRFHFDARIEELIEQGVSPDAVSARAPSQSSATLAVCARTFAK